VDINIALREHKLGSYNWFLSFAICNTQTEVCFFQGEDVLNINVLRMMESRIGVNMHTLKSKISEYDYSTYDLATYLILVHRTGMKGQGYAPFGRSQISYMNVGEKVGIHMINDQ
jgi:hypothetical protein